MINSSMRFSLTGGQVGCSRYTSRPRTSSSILQEISPSGKFPIEILPSGRPRYSQMRWASSGFARPLNILRSFIAFLRHAAAVFYHEGHEGDTKDTKTKNGTTNETN